MNNDTTLDFAETRRQDLKAGFPREMVLIQSVKRLAELKALPEDVEDRNKAISDYERFISDFNSI